MRIIPLSYKVVLKHLEGHLILGNIPEKLPSHLLSQCSHNSLSFLVSSLKHLSSCCENVLNTLALLHLVLSFAILKTGSGLLQSPPEHPYIYGLKGATPLCFVRSACLFPSQWCPGVCLWHHCPILTPLGEGWGEIQKVWWEADECPLWACNSSAIFISLTPHWMYHMARLVLLQTGLHRHSIQAVFSHLSLISSL